MVLTKNIACVRTARGHHSVVSTSDGARYAFLVITFISDIIFEEFYNTKRRTKIIKLSKKR